MPQNSCLGSGTIATMSLAVAFQTYFLMMPPSFPALPFTRPMRIKGGADDDDHLRCCQIVVRVHPHAYTFTAAKL